MGVEKELTDPQAVLKALAEFDQLGRQAFLQKYGFGGAGRFRIVQDDRRYDAKAIIGAARGLQFPERGPLKTEDFASNARSVKGLLEELGFEVQP
jgi:putative restriction endonuclease